MQRPLELTKDLLNRPIKGCRSGQVISQWIVCWRPRQWRKGSRRCLRKRNRNALKLIKWTLESRHKIYMTTPATITTFISKLKKEAPKFQLISSTAALSSCRQAIASLPAPYSVQIDRCWAQVARWTWITRSQTGSTAKIIVSQLSEVTSSLTPVSTA